MREANKTTDRMVDLPIENFEELVENEVCKFIGWSPLDKDLHQFIDDDTNIVTIPVETRQGWNKPVGGGSGGGGSGGGWGGL